ncbi:alpha/beta hydrolase [Streptomyces sp. NPDC048717]|uniref:alpha/beta fold hydrolase n=1 Tax=Streptomyces sp. NPDC048717 TaxID=3154928 RepID=UPI003413638C
MTTTTHKVVSADGTAIACTVRGTGPSVVLVGGALMTGADSAELAGLLAAEHFTVITYDRRGRGGSGDTAPYEVAREIEDLEALIQGPAGGSAALFGMSSGGALALEATARIGGGAVTRLAVYEPPFVTDDSRPPLPADYVTRLTELVGRGAYGDAVEYFMTAAVGVPEEVVAGMRQAPFWAGMEALAPTLSYDGRVMGDTMAGRPLPLDRWASVTVPVLVGSGDRGAPHILTSARELTTAGDNFTLRLFPGEEHAIAPPVLAPALADFFGAKAG